MKILRKNPVTGIVEEIQSGGGSFDDLTQAQKDELKGDPGDKGDPGPAGSDGGNAEWISPTQFNALVANPALAKDDTFYLISSNVAEPVEADNSYFWVKDAFQYDWVSPIEFNKPKRIKGLEFRNTTGIKHYVYEVWFSLPPLTLTHTEFQVLREVIYYPNSSNVDIKFIFESRVINSSGEFSNPPSLPGYMHPSVKYHQSTNIIDKPSQSTEFEYDGDFQLNFYNLGGYLYEADISNKPNRYLNYSSYPIISPLIEFNLHRHFDNCKARQEKGFFTNNFDFNIEDISFSNGKTKFQFYFYLGFNLSQYFQRNELSKNHVAKVLFSSDIPDLFKYM
jgi:hypothetical protein